ncbi:hypothetical protein FQR65_LT09946 [Abscondita terminalis]|nr:hypothetical protein FQR65_LT09946 [Abscondita terminalis]
MGTQLNVVTRNQKTINVKKRVFEESNTESKNEKTKKTQQKDVKGKGIRKKTRRGKKGKNENSESETECEDEDILYAESSSDDFEENPDLNTRWYCFVCQSEEMMDMRLCRLCRRYVHEICVGLTKDIDDYICHECQMPNINDLSLFLRNSHLTLSKCVLEEGEVVFQVGIHVKVDVEQFYLYTYSLFTALTILTYGTVAYRHRHNHMGNPLYDYHYETQSQRSSLNAVEQSTQSMEVTPRISDRIAETETARSNTNVSPLQNNNQQQRPLGSDVAPIVNPPIISSTSSQFPFTTTAPPAFRRCIQACVVTSEYSPVCGTNRVTYNNMSRFRCAQNCGLASSIYNVKCQDVFSESDFQSSRQFSQNRQFDQENIPSAFNNFPISGQENNFGSGSQRQDPAFIESLNPSTPSSTEPTISTTTSRAYLACFQTCPATTEYNPICGTNNQTFHNMSRFRCARKCGLLIFVIFNAVLVYSQFDFDDLDFNVNNNNNNNQQPTTQRATTTTRAPAQFANCFQNCRQRSTSQYNPVCGTNGESYTNMGLLRCAQSCGLRVEFASPGTCGPSPGGK